MSNALQTPRLEDTEITAPDRNTDEPVSVASPIAKKPAYESAKDMLRNPDSDERGRHIVPTLGGEQEMSVEALRKKRRMRRPRPRLTDGQKSAVLLALTFCEGWLVGFAGTHSRIPSPVGTPQWMITGSLVLAVVLPLVFVGILLKWGGDGTAE